MTASAAPKVVLFYRSEDVECMVGMTKVGLQR